MRSEWPEVRLGDHVDACLGKMLDVKKNKGTPEPYLGNSNVRWGTFDLVNLAEMRFEPHEEERYGLLSGDLIVCEGGEPGRCAIWTGTNSPRMKIQKALHRIRPKGNLNNYFLYYWFCYAAKAGLLEQHFTGTTIKHLTGKAIAALKIPLPPIEFQMALVDVLKTLDDCIALLRETNATLEAIVQALFKSWFVDFDPVHARARGEQPADLAPEVAALFPDSFEESALGMIPRGWKLMQFGEFIDRQSVGKKYDQKSALEEGSVPILDQGKSGVIGFHNDKPSVCASLVSPVVVFANHTCYMRLITFDFSAIQNVLPFIGKGVDTVWAFYATKDRVKFSEYKGHWPEFVIQKTIVPNQELTEVFRNMVDPLICSMRNNELQAQTLANLRDTLLPRLISGQLRLPEAEAMVEGAS
ncbi:restriction endonuclease subunit S [Aeromonas salmonicida]|uniref:restriction endonuclease subunit S n=1 Tax=Aeromonas salmonicida TaxID=645 RepID=UPI0012D989D1|nr:restriction endonuclease subunit S [Aeromonas salmonicida]MUG30518.1 restriction endonuclease subunit S [Aeromonas salmonicida]